ncbi:MAG TPA: NAD(P)/FAD-dependent oxidoreductase [Nitrososphaerales archaeon]|nr:NAD(P)/FAD-dependent oxidoreductase [Nitrososphaerales archaeon]
MAKKYDAVVGGGSVAGLAFAAEAAKRGISVLVAEEHDEIGEPEKCDGLVSLRGLRRYGFAPKREVIQNEIASAVVHSPGGRDLAVNATGLDVVVLDRSAYDKQLAERAESWGARLQTRARAAVATESHQGVSVNVGGELVEAKYYVDATGPSSSHRSGILSAAKYEIEADWINERVVEIFADAEKYPGFFAWVIPYGPRLAKVGAAGRGIDAFEALDSFLSTRPHKRLRRVAAPIYVGGPVEEFAVGRRVKVGESAGQVKPTTAGGISTSVAGAVIAARWLSDSIQLGEPAMLARYQPDWESRYLKEMRSMLRIRRVFSKLSNPDMDSVVSLLSSPKLLTKLSRSDFDFHASALLGALGVTGILRLAKVVASVEAKSLLTGP